MKTRDFLIREAKESLRKINGKGISWCITDDVLNFFKKESVSKEDFSFKIVYEDNNKLHTIDVPIGGKLGEYLEKYSNIVAIILSVIYDNDSKLPPEVIVVASREHIKGYVHVKLVICYEHANGYHGYHCLYYTDPKTGEEEIWRWGIGNYVSPEKIEIIKKYSTKELTLEGKKWNKQNCIYIPFTELTYEALIPEELLPKLLS